MTQPYIVSIVMAAYNAERYLQEAVDSLKEQTIGFSNIQLIIVDDGSTDSTPALADKLAEDCSNIQVIHKENGGASSARNTGLPYVQGHYLNFMDSDDKLSPQTLENVYRFFQEHEKETDVVVIPMIYFDGQNEEHALNFFRKETCVADLEEHPEYVAMSMSSTFVRGNLASDIHFDTRLSFAEDARVLLPILLRRKKMGIVSDAIYWYRRHGFGSVSTTKNTLYNPQWYQPYLDYYCMSVIRQCLDECGYVPSFIQYTLAYDLQLRVKLEHIPTSLMTDAERQHYLDTLFKVYSYIEDSVILAQKRSFAEQKLFVLKNKHNALPEFVKKKNNIKLYYGENKVYDLNRSLVTVNFITIQGKCCHIEGTVNYFPSVMHAVEPCLLINGKRQSCQLTDHNEHQYCLDHLVMTRQGFSGDFTLDPQAEKTEVQFMYTYDDMRVLPYKYRFGDFVPLDITFSSAYGCIGNYLLRYADSTIILEKSSADAIAAREKEFLKDIRASQKYSSEDISIREEARSFKSMRPIWLISDRCDQAGDNGEAFFRYLKKHHRFAVNPYFVLTENSPDRERLESIGPVVTYGSQEHKLLYMKCQCMISSHAEDYIIHPFCDQNPLFKDLTAQKPFIYLQHGVMQYDLSKLLNRYAVNIRGFVTTTRPEYDAVCDSDYGYTEKQVWLTGMPRYDTLYNAPEKLVTIMPTWRRHLMGAQNQDHHWIPRPDFAESDYVVFYRSLLQDSRLQETAKQYGYTLAFKPHPEVCHLLSSFALPAGVKILGDNCSYQDAIAKSALLMTDYSSIAFDFAYLDKPLLYYQGDRDTYFSDEQEYAPGYFDFERDGFGEVTYTLDETVDLLIGYMKNGCLVKPQYRERRQKYFTYHDTKCCKRIYQKIRGI